MNLCQICGNEMQDDSVTCRFCGNRQSPSESGQNGTRTFVHRTVNLKEGKPFVLQALQHLHVAIGEARSRQIQVLTVIHGYGSSGRGGAIRCECRKVLDYMCSRGELNAFITGEEYNRRNGAVKSLLSRYPQLAEDKNLNRNNPGITVVVL